MRVLVTGAGGFIGRAVVRVLEERGYEVHAASRTPQRTPGIPWYAADLLDERSARELIARVRPHRLLHLAWIATPGVYEDSPENERWRHASLALLEAFTRAGGERFVGAGTCAEYRWDGTPCSETRTPLEPRSRYGEAKAAFAADGTALARSRGAAFAWGRIFHAYGAGEPRGKFLSSVLAALLAGRSVEVANPQRRLDFVNVRDIAGALAAVLAGEADGPVNVASGTPHTPGELAALAADRLGRAELLRLREHPSTVPDVTAEIGLLRTAYGYEPGVSLEGGLEETLAAMRVAP